MDAGGYKSYSTGPFPWPILIVCIFRWLLYYGMSGSVDSCVVTVWTPDDTTLQIEPALVQSYEYCI